MSNLQRIRKERGLSQSELAKKADISVRTIQNLERGKHNKNGINGMAVMKAYKLSKALDCKIEELLEFDDADEQNTER